MSDASNRWVWIPDKDKVFAKATLLNDSDPAVVKKLDGTIIEVPVNELEKVNPAQFDRANDIAELTYLNEASVVNNLSTRYAEDFIYTYSGLFLVAVNPYKTLPIYGQEFIEQYKGKNREDAPPHIYAVADEAYRKMLYTHENQSILITGESGAGKTENTKLAIQYLSAITGKAKQDSQLVQRAARSIDQRILQANPVLEAFGNAQTICNSNSSRFGKFIRIEFSPSGHISGASIEWYLLEKSRVITQSKDERNYHIFYQFLKGASAELKKKLSIDAAAVPHDFKYLADSTDTIAGLDDAEQFKLLTEAFELMSISSKEFESFMAMVTAVLYMGNIPIVTESSEQGRISGMKEVNIVCSLLGVKPDEFVKALLKPKIKAGRELVVHNRSATQARFTLDALAKSLYERLFGHIVNKLNEVLQNPSSSNSPMNFIGVLDIAGFEIFDRNSFEQLCINYTNEKLQQFFNHHMFLLEQQEYINECIDWEYIDYGSDLQPTIDLIEKSNPMGIFSCLDEDSVMPKASDKSFTDKLTAKWENKCPYFKRSRKSKGFIVHHYAAPVEYDTEGWLMKNKDPVSEAICELLGSSSNSLVASMFAQEGSYNITATTVSTNGAISANVIPTSTSMQRVRRGMFRTVAQRHKEQLNDLMSQLSNTSPHFVRCIVPNAQRQPGKFDNAMVLNQLRCNGVLEGIRIARSGYPNRLDLKQFRNRYQILSKSRYIMGVDKKHACSLILQDLELDPTCYKVGLSKVFFKNGVLAELEDRREHLLQDQAIAVQSLIRGRRIRAEVRQLIFKRQAAELIAMCMHKYLKQRNDPWWQLLSRMRPVLLSADSVENNRKDVRMHKLEESLRHLKNEKAEITRAKVELSNHVETLSREKIEGEERMAAKLVEIVELQKKIDAQEKLNVSLKTELEDAVKKYGLATARITELEQTIAVLEKRVDTDTHENLKREFESLTNDHLRLEQYLKEVEKEKLNAETLSKRNEESLQKLETDLTSEISQLKNVEKYALQQVDEYRTKLSVVETTLEQNRSDYEKELEILKSRNDELEQACAEAEERRAKSDSAINALEETVTQLRTELDKTRDEFFKVEMDYKQSHADLQESRVACEKLQAEFDLTKGELESATKRLVNSRTLLSQLETASADLEKTRAELATLRNLTEKHEELQRSLQKADNEIVSLKSQLSSSQQDLEAIASVKMELARAEARAHECETRLDAVRKELDKERQRNQEVVGTMNKAMKDVEKLQSDKESSQLQVDSLRDQLLSMSQELKARTRELKAFQPMAKQLAEAKLKLENLETPSGSSRQLDAFGISLKTGETNGVFNRQGRGHCNMPSGHVADLEQELADANQKFAAERARCEQMEILLDNLRRDNRQLALAQKQMEKVQYEKGSKSEDHRLLFSLNNQQSLKRELEIERATASEVKKMQSEIRVLKLQLCRSERERKTASTPEQHVKEERDVAVRKAAELERKLKTTELARLQLQRQVTKFLQSERTQLLANNDMRRRDETRPLRVISNDRRVSSGGIRDKAMAMHNSLEAIDLTTELEVQHATELKRNKELSETLEVFRRRAEDYHNQLEKAEVVLTSTKRAENSAKEELNALKNRRELENKHYQSELAALRNQIDTAKKELSDREAELKSLRRSTSEQQSVQADLAALTSQMKLLRTTITDISDERDRLLVDKQRLEKRLAQAWSEGANEKRAINQITELQTHLSVVQQERQELQRNFADLKWEVERKDNLVEQLQRNLRQSDVRVEQLRQQLDEVHSSDASHQASARQASREAAAIRERALYLERELETYKTHLESALARSHNRRGNRLYQSHDEAKGSAFI